VLRGAEDSSVERVRHLAYAELSEPGSYYRLLATAGAHAGDRQGPARQCVG